MTILAALTSILLPVLARARQSAQRTSCQSNLKQIGLAILLYNQDYDERYFLAEYGPSGPVPQVQWYEMVQPYLASGNAFGAGGVFQCPAYTASTNEFAQSYGVHSSLFPSYYGLAPNNAITHPQNVIEQPAQKVIVAEKGNSGQNFSYPVFVACEYYWTKGVGTPPGSKDDNDKIQKTDCDNSAGTISYECAAMPRYRHLESSNMLFADGHVKAVVRGRAQWFTNIYIPHTSRSGDSYDPFQWPGEIAGYYPWPDDGGA